MNPDQRRRGLASAVIDAAMRRAREIGLHAALVYCTAANQLFYQSLGFNPIDSWMVRGARRGHSI